MRTAIWVAIVAVVWAVNPLAAPAHATPACGVNLGAPEIQGAINSVPTVPQGWPWEHNPRSFDPSSNYNPCATLSAVIITVQQATRSSPEQAMLFHDGNYVGTATSKAYGLVSLNSGRTTDDTVVLNYKDPSSSAGDANPTVVTVRYQWQGDHVAMLDPAPTW
jgi:hypothetical protein